MGLILMMGPPGAGKGTQSQKILEARPSWKWISTGNLLRTHVESQSPLGLKAQSFISAGKLVPDDLLNSILLKELDTYHDTHVILDGYPRNISQVKVLSDVPHSILAIFQFVISQAELTKRVASRAKMENRQDDAPSKLSVRLEIYEREMKHVYEHYTHQMADKLCRLSAVGDPDSIFRRVNSFLKSRT